MFSLLLLHLKLTILEQIDDRYLWSSFILDSTTRNENKEAKTFTDNDENQNRKFLPRMVRATLLKRTRHRRTMEKYFWRTIAVEKKNVNEYLWLFVISFERYALNDIFSTVVVSFVLLHIFMPDYCHESWIINFISDTLKIENFTFYFNFSFVYVQLEFVVARISIEHKRLVNESDA